MGLARSDQDQDYGRFHGPRNRDRPADRDQCGLEVPMETGSQAKIAKEY